MYKHRLKSRINIFVVRIIIEPEFSQKCMPRLVCNIHNYLHTFTDKTGGCQNFKSLLIYLEENYNAMSPFLQSTIDHILVNLFLVGKLLVFIGDFVLFFICPCT